MTDHITQDRRSWNMSRIRSRHTKPELVVRSLLHRRGYRFRINYDRLPGVPDIVLPKYRTAIFVHGCFWHRHKNCPKATTPRTNKKYWQAKFKRNVSRDVKIKKDIENLNWHTVVVWECEVMKDPFSVLDSINARFANGEHRSYVREISRQEIMRVAERKNRYYLDNIGDVNGE